MYAIRSYYEQVGERLIFQLCDVARVGLLAVDTVHADESYDFV